MLLTMARWEFISCFAVSRVGVFAWFIGSKIGILHHLQILWWDFNMVYILLGGNYTWFAGSTVGIIHGLQSPACGIYYRMPTLSNIN